MSDTPKPPGADVTTPQIQVDLDEATAQGVYSNLVLINHNDQQSAEPYTVQPADLRGWTLAFEDSAGPRAPFLVLRGTAAVVGDLSHQLFKRTMESLSSPAGATIPLLLRGEYERSFAARVTPQQLLAIARNAGLGVGPLVPRCLGRRRVSDVGSTRQLFFLLFDLPAFAQFRHELSALAVVGQSGTGFDPAAMSPAMVVAMVQSTEDQWLPIAADAAVDCQTPVATTAP